MKQVLLAGMTVLALAASVSVAEAEPITFGYTGSLVTFTVPSTGIYQILAFGAQGGITPGAQTGIGTNPDSGARGAKIVGDFSLTVGDLLQIAVGGAGMPGSGTEGGGGGGGTFVVGPDHAPLVIAGGGGGSGYFFGLPDTPSSVISGQGGLIGPNGGNQSQPGTGTGGNGGSGSGGQLSGGGGGGFFSAGRGPTGGDGFPDLTEGLGESIGLAAGGNGGFGGGGGGFGGGGGGGGYSGGGGGGCSHQTCSVGGGGGSFDAGTNQMLMANVQTGNGKVIINELAAEVPEPGSLALLGTGIIGFAASMRRRCRCKSSQA